jgi:NhaD family Na+/H+ antiporter
MRSSRQRLAENLQNPIRYLNQCVTQPRSPAQGHGVADDVDSTEVMCGYKQKGWLFTMWSLFLTLAALLISGPVFASGGTVIPENFTTSTYGLTGLLIFVAAYILVIFEDHLHLRKSKPVMVAAGLIWVLVALAYRSIGEVDAPHAAVLHNLTEYAELFLFLLSAMTYINALSERNVFRTLRNWLVSRGFSLRTIFWLTGLFSFLISPIADNLTTALLMGAVIAAVGGDNRRFIAIGCINVVVGANAGGAFSPFGDITTLMVWQKGVISFWEFFALFVPSLINWLVPALLMSMFVSRDVPRPGGEESGLKFGAVRIMLLFLLTIATAVSFHNYLHLPPAIGMMLGLGYLGLFAYYIRRRENALESADNPLDMTSHDRDMFDLFRKIRKAEWDTLLFFYGVILCVGGLGQFGYLAASSKLLYQGLGATSANVIVGLLSAVVDNIPVMFAVLTMDPDMSHGQWLLVTLTAGVGGSLLSVGSAAGVALMGQSRGVYTFNAHLKWSWAVALGYAASIAAHMLLNAKAF